MFKSGIEQLIKFDSMFNKNKKVLSKFELIIPAEKYPDIAIVNVCIGRDFIDLACKKYTQDIYDIIVINDGSHLPRELRKSIERLLSTGIKKWELKQDSSCQH